MINEQEHNLHIDEVAASLSGRIPSPGSDATSDEVDLWCEKIELGYEAWRDEGMDDSVDAWD
jgi:hypothetical protein